MTAKGIFTQRHLSQPTKCSPSCPCHPSHHCSIVRPFLQGRRDTMEGNSTNFGIISPFVINPSSSSTASSTE
ncbi:hypothetical protein BDN67DRAFT_795540 [Paxillus ammoniavirescens]|nr:hypothetical protein BDN67DRAFT_795540 [Paxillus ammoniavirescens]